MKVLFDTSVLVAAIVQGHPKHERALPWLSRAKRGEFEFIVSSHTLAELYAVLTTLPIKPRISSGICWRLIHENVERHAHLVSLTTTEYISTIKKVSELGLQGGIIYDALMVKASQKSKVQRVLTLNMKHFKRLWEGNDEVLFEP